MTTRMRVAKIGREELERRCAEGTMYADFVPIGHWIPVEDENMEVVGRYCSECDLPMETEEKSNFCPNCGADMREDEPDAPITREELEKGITTYVEGKYDPIYIGYNPHDCEAMYKCPECGEVHGDWEWVGKREFTCTCGATWNVPK